LRESGQRRDPEPPERITGIILDNVYSTKSFQYFTIFNSLYELYNYWISTKKIEIK